MKADIRNLVTRDTAPALGAIEREARRCFMRAAEFMSQPAITVEEETTAAEAARMMIDNRVNCLPVVDARGELCGVVTPSDYATKEVAIPFSILRAPQIFGHWVSPEGIESIYRSARSTPVGAIMTSPPVTCTEKTSLDEIAATLVEKNVHHMIVVRDRKPVGVIARHDLLRAMARLAAATA